MKEKHTEFLTRSTRPAFKSSVMTALHFPLVLQAEYYVQHILRVIPVINSLVATVTVTRT